MTCSRIALVALGAALATPVQAGINWEPLNKPPVVKPNPPTPSVPVGAEPQAPSQTPEQMTNALLDLMESKRGWGKADREKAKNLAEAIDSLWIHCLNEAELRLRDSRDEIATIATAVLGTCEPDELLMTRSMRLAFRGLDPIESERQVESIQRNVREQAREGIITHLVNYRLSSPQPKK